MNGKLRMSPEDYLKQRLDDQIDWYDSKSVRNQRMYKTLRTVEIVLAAMIPFMVGFIAEMNWMASVVGLCGVVIAVISGVLALNQYQENWLEYRTTCESLRHHRFLYLAKADPYGGDNAFNILVDNVESLISKENTNWSEKVLAVSNGCDSQV